MKHLVNGPLMTAKRMPENRQDDKKSKHPHNQYYKRCVKQEKRCETSNCPADVQGKNARPQKGWPHTQPLTRIIILAPQEGRKLEDAPKPFHIRGIPQNHHIT
mmetsp:Transcript_20991/g.43787  ORF Transcript_20991/g.43787 Transcript_20991/m.43787 type:complete len:103 (-) Transcript_20991:781-1089(-)